MLHILDKLPMYSSEQYTYKLTNEDMKRIKCAMIEDGCSEYDEFFTESGLFGSTPPLANVIYVMKYRNLEPTQTHKVCIDIHTKNQIDELLNI